MEYKSKKELKLEYLKSEYPKYDVCMDEMLMDCCADGLTIGEAFEIYIEAMNWANGDSFYRIIGGTDEKELLSD